MIPAAEWTAWGGMPVVVAVTEERELQVAVDITKAFIELIDEACSRFRTDSEIRTMPKGRPVRVSESLWLAFLAADRGYLLSKGLLDPTVGSVLRVMGYDTDFNEMEKEVSSSATEIVLRTSWPAVRIDRRKQTIAVPEEAEIDFGATAKALCADLACDEIALKLQGGVLVSLGGDIRVAGATPGPGWKIALLEDSAEKPNEETENVLISSGGLATSSSMKRSWKRDGKIVHHIIDPRTFTSADTRWRTVSVIAAACVDANIAATTAIVLGEKAPGWLAENRLPARMIAQDGSIQYMAGWPRPDVVPA